MSNPTRVFPAPVLRTTATSLLDLCLCHSRRASPWANQRSFMFPSVMADAWKSSMGWTGFVCRLCAGILEKSMSKLMCYHVV